MLNDAHLIPGANVHKNMGNRNACMTNDTMKSVIDIIQKKGKEDGEVYATRIIRSLTKQELWDEEKGAVDMPSNTTKRELYENYYFNRGWAMKSDTKVCYPKLQEYKNRKNRKNDEMFWTSYAAPSGVCSSCSFQEVWNEHCQNVCIRRPYNDKCGECTVFRNAFRYSESRKCEREEESDDDSDSTSN
jgi:hypothetical protein